MLVAGIEVRGLGLELGGAGIDRLVLGREPCGDPHGDIGAEDVLAVAPQDHDADDQRHEDEHLALRTSRPFECLLSHELRQRRLAVVVDVARPGRIFRAERRLVFGADGCLVVLHVRPLTIAS